MKAAGSSPFFKAFPGRLLVTHGYPVLNVTTVGNSLRQSLLETVSVDNGTEDKPAILQHCGIVTTVSMLAYRI